MRMGATMEDNMVADFADAGLWVILAAAFAFIVFGCYATRPAPKMAVEDVFPTELDRAA
jgi:hypothetical protein